MKGSPCSSMLANLIADLKEKIVSIESCWKTCLQSLLVLKLLACSGKALFSHARCWKTRLPGHKKWYYFFLLSFSFYSYLRVSECLCLCVYSVNIYATFEWSELCLPFPLVWWRKQQSTKWAMIVVTFMTRITSWFARTAKVKVYPKINYFLWDENVFSWNYVGGGVLSQPNEI